MKRNNDVDFSTGNPAKARVLKGKCNGEEFKLTVTSIDVLV